MRTLRLSVADYLPGCAHAASLCQEAHVRFGSDASGSRCLLYVRLAANFRHGDSRLIAAHRPRFKTPTHGRSRGGLTSKVHAVVDANAPPVRLGLTPGEAHDNRLCSVLLTGLRPQTIVLADRGYDADWIK